MIYFPTRTIAGQVGTLPPGIHCCWTVVGKDAGHWRDHRAKVCLRIKVAVETILLITRGDHLVHVIEVILQGRRKGLVPDSECPRCGGFEGWTGRAALCGRRLGRRLSRWFGLGVG